MTAPILEPVDIPPDEKPDNGDGGGEKDAKPFDPRYPDSTPEAPYGYREDGQPYKRHHGPRTGGARGGRMPATDAQARTAAGLLASVNNITALAMSAGDLPLTAEAVQKANIQFEELAYQALLTDPALCKKILGMGAQSGRAALIMAYAMMTAAVFPAARTEILQRRRLAATEREDDVYQS